MTKDKRRSSATDVVERNIRAIREMERTSERDASWPERVGEAIANFAGTMRFVVLHMLWFTVWISINLGAVPRIQPFDPYPFTFLTFCVSLEAILMTSIVLISQKRLARMTDERAHMDLQINLLAEQESTETLRLLRALCAKNGIGLEEGVKLEALSEETRPSAIAEAVQRHLQDRRPSRRE